MTLEEPQEVRPKFRTGRAAFWICALLLIGLCVVGKLFVNSVRAQDDRELTAQHTQIQLEALRSMFNLLTANLNAKVAGGQAVGAASEDLTVQIPSAIDDIVREADSRSEAFQRLKRLRPVIEARLTRARSAMSLLREGKAAEAKALTLSLGTRGADRDLEGRLSTILALQAGEIAALQNEKQTRLREVDLLFVVVLLFSVTLVWIFAFVDEKNTRRSYREAGAYERQQVLEQLAASANALVYLYDLKEQCNVYVNSGVSGLLGWSQQQVDTFGPRLMDKLLHPEDQKQIPGRGLAKQSKANEVVVSEFRLLHADGSYRWFSARETVYSANDDGSPRQILGSAVDITARKKQERDMVKQLEETRRRNEVLEEGERRLRAEREYLAHAAYTDGLTGLENHRALRHRLEVEFQVHRASGASLSVVMMDLDNFKDLNDRYGHPAGDEALKQVAELLKQAVRAEDCAARYGGEEFSIVCPATSLWQAKVLAERLRKALERLAYRDLRLSASFGVASLDDRSRDPDDLLELADRYLYEAKRLGKNRVCSATGTVLFETAVD